MSHLQNSLVLASTWSVVLMPAGAPARQKATRHCGAGAPAGQESIRNRRTGTPNAVFCKRPT